MTPQLIAERRSIAAGFFGLGSFMGMWGVMIPERVASIGLSELTLGVFLLIIGLSLCAAIFCVNSFAIFQNPARLIRIASIFYVAGFAIVLTTGSFAVLFGVGIITGFAAGLVDAGVNSQASEWEQQSDAAACLSFMRCSHWGPLAGLPC